MHRLFNDVVHQVNRMDVTDVFVAAVVLISVGMFFLRGTMFRLK